ncbi:unnamed protein product, partial [Strongylus vulgaris]
MAMPRRPEPRPGASAIDLAMVAIGSIVATFVFMRFFGEKIPTGPSVHMDPGYNHSKLYIPRNLANGAV